MYREDALLYLCCTQDLSAGRIAQLCEIASSPTLDWSQIFTLAHEHGVAPLIYKNLETVRMVEEVMPAEVAHRFKLATYQNMLAKQKQASQLVNALAYLQSQAIHALAVKGMVLDLAVYAQPWYTAAQDVDLVLRASMWQTSQLELETRFHNSGIEFERDSHHDVTLNGALAVDFSQIWRDATVVDFGGYPLYLMSPEDTLLSICINSCRKRYFRLRSLCDIAETVKRFPNLDWNLLAKRAITYGCNNIVYTALAVTNATVTLPIPATVFDMLAVNTFRRMIIHQAIRYLVRYIPLTSLSYYTGSHLIGRKVGWSLLLPYLTYRWRQMGSKLHEAVTTYCSPRA